jgi:hypothetical protein
MFDGLLQFISGTNDRAALGIFRVIVASVAMPLLLFFVKSVYDGIVKRRDRRRDMYADAFAACMEYREFPYVIYRRNGEKPAEERTLLYS